MAGTKPDRDQDHRDNPSSPQSHPRVLTQCPNCQTTFRVTSEILRVAHGQVRCGRCHTQFDALERLIEEAPGGLVESGRFLKPSEPQIEVEEPAAQEDITLEGRRIEITGTYRTPDQPGDPQIRQEVTEEWVEIDELEEFDPVDTDAEQDDPVAAAGIEVAEALDTDDEFAPAQLVRQVDPEFERVAFHPELETSLATEAASDFDLLAPQPKRTTLAWQLLALPLLLALIAQVVHHYRAELARHPRLGALTMRAYDTLGLPLTPDWNLHAYEVRQWGVLSDPANPGTLQVRASVTNRADFAQPYPLLKLVLEDRWGDQVRAREFEPAEYLDPAVAADRLLGPQQQVNATIAIVDPGPDAEGFRFDICLHGRATAVCATDVPE